MTLMRVMITMRTFMILLSLSGAAGSALRWPKSPWAKVSLVYGPPCVRIELHVQKVAPPRLLRSAICDLRTRTRSRSRFDLMRMRDARASAMRVRACARAGCSDSSY